jgi:hypothetical protein
MIGIGKIRTTEIASKREELKIHSLTAAPPTIFIAEFFGTTKFLHKNGRKSRTTSAIKKIFAYTGAIHEIYRLRPKPSKYLEN